eukprot:CFRG3970T1
MTQNRVQSSPYTRLNDMLNQLHSSVQLMGGNLEVASRISVHSMRLAVEHSSLFMAASENDEIDASSLDSERP